MREIIIPEYKMNESIDEWTRYFIDGNYKQNII